MTFKGREYLTPVKAAEKKKTRNKLFDNNMELQGRKMSQSVIPTALTIGDDSQGLTDSMNPKQQLAITIKNWANIPDNDENLLSEGALAALNDLSAMDDGKIKKHCAGMYSLSYVCAYTQILHTPHPLNVPSYFHPIHTTTTYLLHVRMCRCLSFIVLSSTQ